MPKCNFNKVAFSNFIEITLRHECFPVNCCIFLEPPFLRTPATLLKSPFDMGVLLYICCMFSEHLFLGTPLDGCF